MELGIGTRYSFISHKGSRLALKMFHKIKKKDFCLHFNFVSLFFATLIAKMFIKREKTITIT